MGGHRPTSTIFRNVAHISPGGKLIINDNSDNSGGTVSVSIQSTISEGDTSTSPSQFNVIDNNNDYTIALIALHFETTDKAASSVAIYTHTKTTHGNIFTILQEHNHDESILKISLDTTSGKLAAIYTQEARFRVVKTKLI